MPGSWVSLPSACSASQRHLCLFSETNNLQLKTLPDAWVLGFFSVWEQSCPLRPRRHPRATKSCHPDRRAAAFAARSGGIVATTFALATSLVPFNCHSACPERRYASPPHVLCAMKSLLDSEFRDQIILPPCLPASSNKDSRFVMLNYSLTCWLALMISIRQPRVRPLTYNPTTVPRPALSICGTPCKSSTMRFRSGISGFTSSFKQAWHAAVRANIYA